MIYKGIEFELRGEIPNEAGFRAQFDERMDEAMRDRKQQSDENFEEWYADFQGRIQWPSDSDPEDKPLVLMLNEATRAIALRVWEAREPELALADIKQNAALQLLTKYKEKEQTIDALRAENARLRWTIEKVLGETAPPPVEEEPRATKN